MTEPPPTPPTPTIGCHQCGREVPDLEYCIVCGDPLADERAAAGRQRTQFSAAPDEPATALRVFTTLFPQLPRADLAAFRWALALGGGLIAGLAALALYPVALVAAAVIVPLLFVLYLYDIDVYEDEPVRVIGATMAWGAGSGILAAVAGRLIWPAGSGAGGSAAADDLATALLLPVIHLVLVCAGPLLLLNFRRFNDVLDGATFGTAAGVSFSGAFALTTGLDVLRGGLRPGGDPLPWLVTLGTVAIVLPVLYGAAAGTVCAAFWLRYRAPIGDRSALGPIGSPVMAVGFGLVMLIGAGVAGTVLGRYAAAAVTLLIAAVGLVALRRAIHLGLLEESREAPIRPPARCANCGRTTDIHTFCGHCGIALKALPKTTTRTDPAADPTPGPPA